MTKSIHAFALSALNNTDVFTFSFFVKFYLVFDFSFLLQGIITRCKTIVKTGMDLKYLSSLLIFLPLLFLFSFPRHHHDEYYAYIIKQFKSFYLFIYLFICLFVCLFRSLLCMLN